MAASDKNILISPQRGSATQSPSIRFTGDGNDPISIYALDGVPGSLSIEGSAGQLFSLTNNLTSGSIFSVNDVSGLPSIDVNASGLVQIAPFSGTLAIGKSTVTSGQTVDIKGNVRIDGTLIVTSSANISSLSSTLLDGSNTKSRFLSLSLSDDRTLTYPGILNLGNINYNYNFLNGSWTTSITAGIMAHCADQWEIAVHDASARVVSPFMFDGGANHRLLMGRDIGWGTMPIEAANSFRAPIFYDSNDTAYYVDPASGSVLNGNLIINQAAVSYSTMDNTPVVGSITNNRLHVNGSIQLTSNDDAIVFGRGTATFLKDEELGFGWGGGWYMTDGNFLRVRGSKILYNNYIIRSDTDMRAPVFYDQNNTGYYLDPDSTSNLGLVRTQDLRALGQVRATGWYGTNSSSHSGPAIEIGVSPPDGTNGYILAYNRNSGSYLNMNFNATAFTFGGQSGGFLTCDTSIRAPIFYDTANTAYYTDPASTSRINDIHSNTGTFGARVNGSAFGGSVSTLSGVSQVLEVRASGSIPLITWHYENIATRHIGLDSSGFLQVYNPNEGGGSVLQANSSLRAPIFYDSQDTSYYLNLNHFSRLDRLVLNQSRINSSRFPVGHYASGDTVFEIDPSWTGDQLQAYFNEPVNWVDDSTAPGGYAIQVTGPANVGGAYGSGFPYIPVDQDDVFYMEVWIKNVAGSNIHYMGSVDFNSGFGSLGGNPGSFGYWVMSGSNPGNTWTKYSGYITGFGSSTGQFVSGTKYFTPLALFNYSGGTSYISGWKCIRTTHQGNRTIVGRSGSITDNSNYALDIFHPTSYRQLRVRSSSHPLIKLSGDYNGGNGAEIWQNSSGTLIFNVNGSQSGVYVNPGPYTELLGSARSPAFYDSNDTSYYLDPNGSSQLYAVRANNWFRPQSETGLYSESYGQHFYPDSAGFLWESDGPIRIRAGYEGVIQGTLGYHDSNGFGFLDDGGNWWLNTQNNEAHLVIGGSQALNAHSGATGRRLMFGGGDADAQSNYYIGTNLENYGGSYNKLDLRWHTGIRMGAQPSYGGIRFYDTEDLGTQVFAIGKDGSYAQANQSMRAPIFYDLDNTGYYLDPASTSYVNALQTNGSLTVGNSTSSDIYMTDSDEGSRRIHCNSNRIGFLNDSNGWGAYCSDNGDWTTDTISYAGASHRSPIFYDSNNTGYYTDPASTSTLNALTLNSTFTVNNGWSYVANNYGYGIVGLYASTVFQLVFAMGDAYKTTAGGGINNLYGIAWSHPNAGGIAGNLNTHGALITENGAFLAALSGSIRCRDDMRAPLFYDSNNTGYYLDPASTSNLNALNTAGTTILGDTKINFVSGAGGHTFSASHYSMGKDTANGGWSHPHYSDLIIGYHTGIRLGAAYSGIRFYSNSPTTDANNDGNGDGGESLLMTIGGYVGNSGQDVNVNNILYAGASMRTPVFYDNNDTGYYLDPNTTSDSALRIRGGALHGPNPTWGSYLLVGGDGRQNRTNDASVASVCSTNGNLHIDAASGFHTYINHYDGNVIYFGGGANNNWGEWSSGILYSYADTRSPIFYDYSNTAYYCDPNSTSYLYHLILSGASYFRPQNWIQMDGSYGMYWPNTNGAHLEGNTLSSYGSIAIRGSRNGWRGIHFYDGGSTPHLMFDGSSNGGIYFESGGRWASYYSYGNNCWGFGTSSTSSAYNIYCPTGVYSGGRVDGTIFYDSNNTGYYCDPASTSNLNSVSMQGGNVYGPMNFASNSGGYCGSLSSPPLQAYSNSNNSAFMSFHKGGYYAVNFGLDADSVLRIGGWSASANRWQLDMSGNMTAAGNVTAYSDIRLKDNIKPIDNALEKTLQLNGVTFTRKDQEDKEKRHAGVIAQEVEKVLPEVVSEDNEGIKNVAYGNMVGLLIEAIKDQQKMIEELRKEVDNLKKSV